MAYQKLEIRQWYCELWPDCLVTVRTVSAPEVEGKDFREIPSGWFGLTKRNGEHDTEVHHFCSREHAEQWAATRYPIYEGTGSRVTVLETDSILKS